MKHDDTQFPVRLLFTAVGKGMGRRDVAFAGPQGVRRVSACLGGQFSGGRLSGAVVAEHSNEWQLASSDDPQRALVEGLLTLCCDDGEAVLVSYRGRSSGRYGPGSARVGMNFEAGAGGRLDWLNDVHAVAHVETRGDDLHFTAYELLDRPAEDGGFLPVEPLYRMSGEGSIGKRYAIAAQTGGRYLSMAEEGCAMQGHITGHWRKGYAWGPHRTGQAAGTFPWAIDMRVAMQTEDGIGIIQHYMGAISRELVSPDPAADHSWRTTALYETDPAGRLGWLCDILAIGKGWKDGGEAHYYYYTLL